MENNGIYSILADMCKKEKFNYGAVVMLLETGIDVNLPLLYADFSYINGKKLYTCLMQTAIDNNNLKMVKLLFKYGANPNFIYDDECPWWDLQYAGDVLEDDTASDNKNTEDYKTRLEIALLFLEKGADPFIDPYADTRITLFDSVLSDLELGRERDYDENWEYTKRFFIYLFVYGSKCNGFNFTLLKPVRKDKVNLYEFRIDDKTGKWLLLNEKKEVICDEFSMLNPKN